MPLLVSSKITCALGSLLTVCFFFLRRVNVDKIVAMHVPTKSALNLVIFLVYLLRSSDLHKLNGISNDAESCGGLCLDFSIGNYCLWTNSVLGSIHNTTKKLIATTKSFNHSRIHSTHSFNLPRLRSVGIIHPNPGP